MNSWEFLQQLDKDMLLYINQLGTPFWDNFWIFITNKYSSIPLYFILLLMSYRYQGLKKTVWLCLFVVLLITATDQLANVFKYGFERLRPCHEPTLQGLRVWKCGGKFGYFSAHAASSFALATFFVRIFSNRLPKLKYILFFWAFLVSISRIYLAVHYPFDVLTGMFFGVLFGIIFAKFFKDVSLKISSNH